MEDSPFVPLSNDHICSQTHDIFSKRADCNRLASEAVPSEMR
jgi:hypothetical protein